MPKSCAHVGGQRKNFCTSKPGRCGNGRGTTPLPNCFMPFLEMCIFGDREIQIYIYTHVGSQLSELDHIYIYVFEVCIAPMGLSHVRLAGHGRSLSNCHSVRACSHFGIHPLVLDRDFDLPSHHSDSPDGCRHTCLQVQAPWYFPQRRVVLLADAVGSAAKRNYCLPTSHPEAFHTDMT